MESILDQYADDKLEIIPEEPIVMDKKPIKKRKLVNKDDNNTDIEEKREQLSILVVLGTIDTYTGHKMSLEDVKRLPSKDVEKYHNRYQVTMGNKVTSELVDTALETGVELLSYAISIYDKKDLCNVLKKNELVKQELNNAAGYVVLKGGRFVALASGLLQIAKHIDFKPQIEKNDESVDEMDKYINDTVDKTLELS